MVANITAHHALSDPSGFRQVAALAGLAPEQRAVVKEALAATLTYIPNALFSESTAEYELFEVGMAIPPAPLGWYRPRLGGKWTAPEYRRPSLLSRQEEKHLFLRYNYARWRTIGAVEAFRTQPTRAGAAALALWYGRVKDTRDRLVEANLALVLSLARRTRGRMVDFDELISEGNVALLRAINAFDAARGFKFSTYACPAIVKSFSRLLSKTGRARAVCPVQYDPAMERSTHQETSRDQTRLDTVTALLRILVKNRAQLTDIEQRIIDTRFALHREPDQPTMTLEEVGRVVGVTKERVRQIQNVALAKLRASLQKEAF